jgi:hypothetical protein
VTEYVTEVAIRAAPDAVWKILTDAAGLKARAEKG